jgi:hypothetical protein
MRKAILFVLLLLPAAYAQEKVPQLPADSKVTILKIQLHQKQLEVQGRQLQAQVEQLNREYQDSMKQLADAMSDGYKAANADQSKWTLNSDSLEFTKKPEAPKKEEAKKP